MQHGPLGIPSPTLTSPVVAAFLNTAMTDVLAITEMPKDANFFGEVVSGKQQVTRFQFALRPGQHRDQYAVRCAHHLADAARLRGALPIPLFRPVIADAIVRVHRRVASGN